MKALVHENYDINDELHQNDIGKLQFNFLRFFLLHLVPYYSRLCDSQNVCKVGGECVLALPTRATHSD